MGSMPLVALSVHPPEPLPNLADQRMKAMQLNQLGQQTQQQAALYPGQQQLQQQQIQSSTLDLQEKQKQMDDQAKIEKIFQDSGDDMKSAIPKVMAINPTMGIQYQKSIMDSETAALNQKKAIIGYHSSVAGRLAELAGGVKDESSFHSAIGQALSENLIDAPTAAKYLSQPFSPEEVTQIQQQALSAKDQLEQADKALTLKETAKRDAEQQARDVETARHNKASEKIMAGGGGNVLTGDALDQAAERYSTTGQMPPISRGASGIAQSRQIMNRAAELHPNQVLATNSAEFKANQSSLTKLQSNFDQVSAFENTAGKNLDVFLAAAQKVVDSGSPWINKPLRGISSGALGSADLAAFNAARTTALTEISKVLNSANASAVVSDSGRREVESLIGPDASLKQIMSAAQILKTDMGNRHQAYQDQIGDIQKRLGSAQDSGAGVGNVTVTDPRGKVHTFPDQKSADNFKKAAGIK